VRGCGHQHGADALGLVFVRDMKVVDERAPQRVGVAHEMNETHEVAVDLRNDRVLAGCRVGEPLGPHAAPVCLDIAVQERIGIRAPVVAPPAVGM
jgi:hypothetical protein